MLVGPVNLKGHKHILLLLLRAHLMSKPEGRIVHQIDVSSSSAARPHIRFSILWIDTRRRGLRSGGRKLADFVRDWRAAR
jgi:hypothetical protein